MNSLRGTRRTLKSDSLDMPKEELETIAREQWEKTKTIRKINKELEMCGDDFKIINYSGGQPYEPDLQKRNRRAMNTILFYSKLLSKRT